MSVHIAANPGDIAERVLLPGDPLRAKFIAETFLENPVCYTEVRGMYGFTGTYKGQRVSVQGTGMGIPSATIYATELIESYGAKKLVRVGTAGALSEDIHVRDIVIASACSTTSNMIARHFDPSFHFAPVADFDLLLKAYKVATERGYTTHVGNILSEDAFYNADNHDQIMKMAKCGVMAIEMEAAGLYYLAAEHHVQALAVMTISDHIITGEVTSAEERQTTFKQMIEVGLEAVLD